MAHKLSLAFLTVFDANPVEAVRIAAGEADRVFGGPAADFGVVVAGAEADQVGGDLAEPGRGVRAAMTAFFSALSVANSGSSSITTGSPAVTVRLTIFASGLRLYFFSASSLTISTALAPSQIWLDEAAVSTPSTWSAVSNRSTKASRSATSAEAWVPVRVDCTRVLQAAMLVGLLCSGGRR